MRNCFSGNFSRVTKLQKQFPLFSCFWVNKNGSWVMTYNQDEHKLPKPFTNQTLNPDFNPFAFPTAPLRPSAAAATG